MGARLTQTLLPGRAPIALALLMMLIPFESFGQSRLAIEPSVDVTELHDDNLFFSSGNQARDQILRVTPAVSLRRESPHWLLSGSYSFDSERFSRHPELTTLRARERALASVHYQPGPRLTVTFDGAYTDTNTPADLNVLSGLATSRIRATRVSTGASARYRMSPRSTVLATDTWITDTLEDGSAMSEQLATVGLERQMTSRNLLALEYEVAHYAFDLVASTQAHAVRLGWTYDLGARTRLQLRAGPRVTDRSPMADVSAVLTHARKLGSVDISYQQTETRVIGYLGTIGTKNLQARAVWSPFRSLTSYVTPAIFRSGGDGRQVTVYRMALGTRYAITPLMAIDVAYWADIQQGALDSFGRGGDELRHRTLSIGLTTRWSNRRGIRPGTGPLK